MVKTSRNDLEVLVRHAGLPLSLTEIDQVYEGWTLMEPILDRIRGRGPNDPAEPAHIFRADSYTQRSIEREAL